MSVYAAQQQHRTILRCRQWAELGKIAESQQLWNFGAHCVAQLSYTRAGTLNGCLHADGFNMDLLVIKDWPTKEMQATRKLLQQGTSISLPSFPSAGQTGPSAAGDARAAYDSDHGANTAEQLHCMYLQSSVDQHVHGMAKT